MKYIPEIFEIKNLFLNYLDCNTKKKYKSKNADIYTKLVAKKDSGKRTIRLIKTDKQANLIEVFFEYRYFWQNRQVCFKSLYLSEYFVKYIFGQVEGFENLLKRETNIFILEIPEVLHQLIKKHAEQKFFNLLSLFQNLKKEKFQKFIKLFEKY